MQTIVIPVGIPVTADRTKIKPTYDVTDGLPLRRLLLLLLLLLFLYTVIYCQLTLTQCILMQQINLTQHTFLTHMKKCESM